MHLLQEFFFFFKFNCFPDIKIGKLSVFLQTPGIHIISNRLNLKIFYQMFDIILSKYFKTVHLLLLLFIRTKLRDGSDKFLMFRKLTIAGGNPDIKFKDE